MLERLANAHDVAFLLTRPDRPRGRGRRLGAPPAKEVAERLGVPVLQPERLTPDLALDADAMVIAAYGVLIPEALLERQLWLNVHPSLLPRWRGAAPIERALMAGDRQTGVTVHETTAELDAGPIAAQRAVTIADGWDAGGLSSVLAEMGAELVDEVLPEPRFRPQPDEGVTYAEKITAAERELDLSRPADENLNRIRALSPHIGARAVLNGRPVIVWRARVVDGELEPLEVQPEGRRRMTYDEFVRGLR